MDNDLKVIEEELTGLEWAVMALATVLMILAAWTITLLCYIVSPHWLPLETKRAWRRALGHDWSQFQWTKQDFRLIGLQDPPRDWSGLVIAITTLVAVISTLVALSR